MFKKPVCPYCKAIYFNKEIKKQGHNEEVKCHNCKKIFVVKKLGGLIILLLLATVLAVLFDCFLILFIKVESIFTLLFSTVILIYIAFLFNPFFVKYKKKDKDKKSGK